MSARSLIMAAAGQVGPPDAPKFGTATAISGTSATVSFTAPSANGSPITSYTATSSPGGITATLEQAGSGTITITGLTQSTAYTFTIRATNAKGTSPASANSNSITTAAAGWTQSFLGYSVAGLEGSSNGQFFLISNMGTSASRTLPTGLYRSVDYGVNWTKIYNMYSVSGTLGVAPAQSMISHCAISNDGQVIVIFAQLTATTFRLLRSMDAGATWTNYAVPAGMYSIYVSLITTPDCSILYAFNGAVNSGTLYASYDYGSTWTTLNSGSNTQKICCSDNGSVVSSGGFGTVARVSYDYGATWATIRPTFTNQPVMSISGNGAVMVITAPRLMYVSTDSGSTWTARTNNVISLSTAGPYWVSSTYTGNAIVVSTGVTSGVNSDGIGSGIYKSTDYGITWTDMSSPQTAWYRAPINSNATQIAIQSGAAGGLGPYTDQVWIYQ